MLSFYHWYFLLPHSGYRSTQRTLERGVPQGFVMGPLLYLLYTSPIADIIKSHKLEYHLYADDTQLYISLKIDCSYDLSLAKRRVECCVIGIDRWMVIRIKLNLFSSAQNFDPGLL